MKRILLIDIILFLFFSQLQAYAASPPDNKYKKFGVGIPIGRISYTYTLESETPHGWLYEMTWLYRPLWFLGFEVGFGFSIKNRIDLPLAQNQESQFIGEKSQFPISLTLLFFPLNTNRFSLYFGGGVDYNINTFSKNGGIDTITQDTTSIIKEYQIGIDNNFSWHVNLGFEVKLNIGLSFYFLTRYTEGENNYRIQLYDMQNGTHTINGEGETIYQLLREFSHRIKYRTLLFSLGVQMYL